MNPRRPARPLTAYAVASVGKAGQHNLAGPRTARRHRVHIGPGEVQPAETVVAIAHPRAIIDALPHRLAVFAVARDIDADVPLPANDLSHDRPQLSLELSLVDGLAGFAGAVRLYQPIRARQAADMGGQDVIGAGPHR